MKDYFELREELEQLDEKTKLARIALVGALAAGIIASGRHHSSRRWKCRTTIRPKLLTCSRMMQVDG